MHVSISRSSVQGTTRIPPSKSYTHRALLAAGYGSGATVIDPLDSADTRATAHAVEAYGGTVDRVDDSFEIVGFDGRPATPADVIDCKNSGTTMRLTAATGALVPGLTVLTGDGSLRERPQGPLLDALRDLGAQAESTRGNGRAPLIVGGAIEGGPVAIPGDVSSQYITALLMAGAVTDKGIDIKITTALKSAPYVEITLEVLHDFGIAAEATANGFRVPGDQVYAPKGGEYAVPGDFSSASYLLAAGALAGQEGLTVVGTRPSAQGDTAIVNILRRMGADLSWDRDAGVIVVNQSSLTGVSVDVGDTPDLLPTIAAVGAAADGTTRITNCEHVRYKETDRVSAMAKELTSLGAVIEERPDELVVRGKESSLVGTTVQGHSDHRIVMALAVTALVADGTTTIKGADHVDVSFPGFFDALRDLGADVDS